MVAAASSTHPQHMNEYPRIFLKWQVRKFSVLFNPNFWYFNVTDFLSQMSASLLFFILLSQQAYKYFQWNFTKWHILHFVNQIYTNSSLTPLSSSVSGLNAFAFLTLDSSLKCPVFKLYPGQVIPEFKGRLRGK